MLKRSLLKKFTSWTAVAAAIAAAAPAAYATAPSLTAAQKVTLLRQHVKYVFVIFHENESFDHYFGTFPGANGLFSAPQGATAANANPNSNLWKQRYLDKNNALQTVTPFLMPQAVQVGGYNSGGAVVPIYPADMYSVDHSHSGMANGMDMVGTAGATSGAAIINGTSLNDRYAMDQEGYTTNASGSIVKSSNGAAPTSTSEASAQQAEVDVGHIDCDTLPFMWSWAKNFVLFDNYHQTIVGPSTANAIAVISGQSGQTQYALHPTLGAVVTSNAGPNVAGANYGSAATSKSNNFVPVVGDPGPWPGSANDTSTVTVKPPYNNDEGNYNTSYNLTFASLPLSFMGANITAITAADQSAMTTITTPTGVQGVTLPADLADVADDIAVIKQNPAVNWGWYQQGYDAGDSMTLSGYVATRTYSVAANSGYTSTTFVNSGTPQTNPATPGLYDGYVLHHNAAQYFGYIADNNTEQKNIHGAAAFMNAVNNRTLPASGGVFYLRGGYNNNFGLVPLLASAPNDVTGTAFLGNDDHGSYSDQQISEALSAKAINAIVNSPYWSQSVIVITYDESDGYYDHAPVTVRNTFVDGSALAAGPRIPTILISPWAAAGTISHAYSEHSSLIKLIDTIFNLTPLGNLPDEMQGATNAANGAINQTAYGPADGLAGDPNNTIGNMLEAFDYTRMQTNKPISGALATFPDRVVMTLPHLAVANPNVNPTAYSPNGYTNGACAAVGILPTDFASWAAYKAGTPSDPYPADVNPRPTASPGVPSSGTWAP